MTKRLPPYEDSLRRIVMQFSHADSVNTGIRMKHVSMTMMIAGSLLAGGSLFRVYARSNSPRPGVEESSNLVQRVRLVRPFDSDWLFQKADLPGAERPVFDDASWRRLNVPHDWAIEGPFDEHSPVGGAGGFLPSGVGWYRKHFTLPAAYAHRLVFIEFDGVMANSSVFINGVLLGKRPYGYVSFSYLMTGHLNFGDGPNVLAVRADNSGQPASR